MEDMEACSGEDCAAVLLLQELADVCQALPSPRATNKEVTGVTRVN